MARAAFNPNTLLLVTGLVLIGAIAAFAGYFSGTGSNTSTRFPAPDAPPPVARGVVQTVTAGSVTLQTDAGSRDLRLTPSTSIEALRPVAPTAVRPGDWLNAGGLPQRQTMLVLTGLVVLPDGTFTAPAR